MNRNKRIELVQHNREFSVQEIDSLRFYQGDVDKYSDDVEKNNSVFWKTEKAYQLLNMLLYPGLENENSRIKKEKKKIPIELLMNLQQIFAVYENIFSAMCKYSLIVGKKEEIYVYRKDRMQYMEGIEKNRSYSWTSCSLKEDIDDSFQKKDGILLLEYKIPYNIPHIVMNDVLGKNKFQEQKEVLLPPFLIFEKNKIDFTEKEMEYRDINGQPPKAKYLLYIKKISFSDEKNKCTKQEIEKIVFDNKNIFESMNLLRKMQEKLEITEDEKNKYVYWKSKMQDLVKIRFEEIYDSYGGAYYE